MDQEQKVNILLVDDRPENLMALESVLGSLDQNLVKAGSGREALKHVLQTDFAVILLDVQMPEMDGFETAEIIRSRERSRHTPIVFLTAINKSEMHVSRGYSVGAVDYLFKPFDSDILKAKVSVFVELSRKARALEREIGLRREAEEEVRTLNADLERRVAQRTAELEEANRELKKEVSERRKAEEERSRVLRLEQAARAEAEAAQQRLAFLGEASACLATSLDFETTLVRVAELAVPYLCDFCVVDVAGDDANARRVAMAHHDAAMQAQLRELQQRYWPERPALASASAEAEHPPEPLKEQDVSWLIGSIPGHAHLGAVQELSPTAYLVVPLVARGRSLGMIGFGLSTPGREFGPADVRLAEDLARRAAGGIDNARLFREVQAAAARKDEFMAMLAHELRNPLAAIANASILLNEIESGDPRSARIRATLSRQTEHLARLVDDLLDVSRISRGKVELRPELLDLRIVVQRALETSRLLLEERGHEVSVSLPPEPAILNGDATRLEQVVSNLVNNAAKYTEPGGNIWLSLATDGPDIVLRVRDTGAGIPRDLLPHIFELFTQADRSLDRSQGGLGIGLALVHSLVHLHGGSVEAYSDGPGQGSEFVVRLPQGLACPLPAPPDEATVDAAAAPPHGEGTALRILLVDDNEDAAESLADLLGLWGHDVSVAHDGPGALERTSDAEFDLLLVDIGLPGMNGYELARHLRRQGSSRDAMLVALTGYGQEEDRRRSREAGFDHHLVKPVDLSAVRDLLTEVGEKRHTPQRAG